MILFSGTDTNMARAAKLKLMLAEIERYERDYILSADVEKLVEYLWQKYRFEIPTIHFEKRVIVDRGESGNGVYIRLSIPYEGSREVLGMHPMTYQGGCPDGDISDHAIQITYNGSDSGYILATIEREQKAAEVNLKFVANDLKAFDTELQGRARVAIEQKRSKFASNMRLVDSLGIPMLQREESPPTYPAPEVRRKPPIASPPVADKPSQRYLKFSN